MTKQKIVVSGCQFYGWLTTTDNEKRACRQPGTLSISELAIADNTDDGFVSEIKKGCEYYTSFEVVEHTRLELVTFRLPV